MSNKYYSEPESIFSVPDDVTPLDVEDALGHAIARVKGSIVTLSMSIEGNDSLCDIPPRSMADYLHGVSCQLEIIEKLVKYKIKEARGK